MIKLYRKKRKNSLKNGKNKNYFKYAIGETLLLVAGILMALYIDNLNTKRIENMQERTSYQNLKRQINDDKKSITINRDANNEMIEKYKHAVLLINENTRSKIDTLGKIALNLYFYSDFDRSSNIYQNLLNSGESKLMKNKEIIEKIQRLEETYIHINRMEKIHFENILNDINPDIKKSFKLVTRKVRDEDHLFSVDFQNHFSLIIYIAELKREAYVGAIGKIDEITVLIDEELNSSK